jgi:predicted aldo/keto reductase-like oxidoreductase
MALRENRIDRRQFLNTTAAAGVGYVITSAACRKGESESQLADDGTATKPKTTAFPQVPRRRLGRTGEMVPSLSFGAMFDVDERPAILEKTFQWGVNYWDTASSYANGNSEIGIGKFLAKYPERRKELFIVSKASRVKKARYIEKKLQKSLERMNTDYIDLYYGVHGLSDPKQLTHELKEWARDAKNRKLIKYFGFSTHKNMAKCLTAAAELDWIDAIMTSYNFRLMQDDEMQAAVEACHKAGIGLIAMKTQAFGQEMNTDEDRKMAQHFMRRGFTTGQAKLKIVLQDERISSACVGMPNIALVTTNVAAVLDKTELSSEDKGVFKNFANSTCSGYCAGCGEICGSAVPEVACVSDVMRYLMYYNSYGQKDRARRLFSEIPAGIRKRIARADYSRAEALCPQRLPIQKLMSQAVEKLA